MTSPPQRHAGEYGAWLDRLTTKYGLPRAVLVRMLDAPGSLEVEIGTWIAERATDKAHALFERGEDAPTGNGLWERAVRGVYMRLADAKVAADEAEKRARWAETDAYLAQVKAGQE
jgi:hypothetical protein